MKVEAFNASDFERIAAKRVLFSDVGYHLSDDTKGPGVSCNMDKIQRHGQVWNLKGETWHTVIDGRFHAVTWAFGSIHQSKVIVEYEHSGSNFTVCERGVGVCLAPGKTRDEAMEGALNWIESYKAKGPRTPGQVIDRMFWEYPDLFDSRSDALAQLFFTTGGGYGWLDGAVIPLDEEVMKWEPRKSQTEWLQEKIDMFTPLGSMFDDVIIDLEKQKQEELAEIRAKAERTFSISRYSNISRIPPDVRTDWMITTIEALQLLARRGDETASSFAKTKLEELVKTS